MKTCLTVVITKDGKCFSNTGTEYDFVIAVRNRHERKESYHFANVHSNVPILEQNEFIDRAFGRRTPPDGDKYD